MDFSLWTKSLPFKGLDELAAQDEYINSQGLHVRRDNYNSDEDDDSQQQQQQQHEGDTELTSLTGASYDVETTLQEPKQPQQQQQQQQQQNPLQQQQQQQKPLQQQQQQQPQHIHRHHHSFPSLNIYNDDKEEQPDEEENDFVSPINPTKNKNNNNSRSNSLLGVLEMELSESHDDSEQYQSITIKKPKHRFLEELDSRLAKKNDPTTTRTLSSVRVSLSSSNTNNTTNNNNNNSRWFFGAMGGAAATEKNKSNTTTNDSSAEQQQQQNDEMNTSLPPLSRQRIKSSRSAGQQSLSLQDQNFDKVKSMVMLDADDLVALQQLKQLNETQYLWTDQIKETIQGHAREAFVALTLLLAMAVYFFRRHTSNEDDVH